MMKGLSQVLFSFLLAKVSFAQVPVRDEPRHHNIFENNFVRVLDVRIRPGDTTLYHLHATPSVFIYFTKTKVGSNLVNQPALSNVNTAGNISYDSLQTPRIHRVWNEDSTWFHVMDVEIVNPQPARTYVLPKIKNAALLFDKPLVIGYKVQLKTGDIFSVKGAHLPLLLISLGEATLQVSGKEEPELRAMKPGHFIWIRPNEPIMIKTMDSYPAGFALLGLK